MNIQYISTIQPNIEATPHYTPILGGYIPAGFPSPAEQYQQDKLDLNEYVIKHPSATYFAWAKGNSMEGVGIFDGDLLVIDRSLSAKNQDVVIAAVDGDLTCKRLNSYKQQLEFVLLDQSIQVIPKTEEITIEGVVIGSFRAHRT